MLFHTGEVFGGVAPYGEMFGTVAGGGETDSSEKLGDPLRSPSNSKGEIPQKNQH